MRKLLEQKANPNVYELDYHNTPLMMAAAHGSLNIVKILLEAKAAANYQNKDGSAALHGAADIHRADIAEALLDAKAAVNISMLMGATALHIIAQKKGDHVEFLSLLLASGANIHSMECSEDMQVHATPLKIARDCSNDNCFKALQKASDNLMRQQQRSEEVGSYFMGTLYNKTKNHWLIGSNREFTSDRNPIASSSLTGLSQSSSDSRRPSIPKSLIEEMNFKF